MAQKDATEESEEDEYGEDEFGRYAIDSRAWSMNEIRDHPLFMEDVPRDISDNPHLLALQNMLYEDQSPEDLAEHFKKLGNEALQSSNNSIASQNALLAYTRGLEMESSDKKVLSQLHSNRAAVSLRLQEHTKVVDDCRRAIELDPDNMKAYFRGAKASEALGLSSRALKFCDMALRRAPEDAEFKKLHGHLSQKLKREEEARQKEQRLREEAMRKMGAYDDKVRERVEARGTTLGPPLFDMKLYELRGTPKLKLTEDGEAVQWPLLVLYPEVNQSDFVETFDERCALEDQFQIMFPADHHADWDEQGRYVWDRLVSYLEIYPEDGQGDRTIMRRVNPPVPLVEALAAPCRAPPCLTLHVFVDGAPAHQAFCEEHSL